MSDKLESTTDISYIYDYKVIGKMPVFSAAENDREIIVRNNITINGSTSGGII